MSLPSITNTTSTFTIPRTPERILNIFPESHSDRVIYTYSNTPESHSDRVIYNYSNTNNRIHNIISDIIEENINSNIFQNNNNINIINDDSEIHTGNSIWRSLMRTPISISQRGESENIISNS